MDEHLCDNCKKSISVDLKSCDYCGYPQQGTKQEKIAYNAKLLKTRDLVEESDKSITAVFSLSIIFFFMSAVVLAFSLIFGENHYIIALFFAIAGKVYYLLSRLGKRTAYLTIVLAMVFYMLHTIFEFSYGIFPKSPVNVNDSFIESKGASIVYAMIPLAYILLRFTLMIVLLKFLFTQIKLKHNEKMVRYIRDTKAADSPTV